MTNREEGLDEFEQWLRTECFQAPPAHAYDLALSAWKAALKSAAPAEKPQAEPMKFYSNCKAHENIAWTLTTTAYAHTVNTVCPICEQNAAKEKP